MSAMQIHHQLINPQLRSKIPPAIMEPFMSISARPREILGGRAIFWPKRRRCKMARLRRVRTAAIQAR
jgi:hypothetical protein